jgi:hypothetical protein
MRRAVTPPRAGLAALLAALLAGCGPSVESAYRNCAETAYKQAIGGNRAMMSKETASLFEKAARVQADRQCGFIRDLCNRDPQSEECKRLVQQYGK